MGLGLAMSISENLRIMVVSIIRRYIVAARLGPLHSKASAGGMWDVLCCCRNSNNEFGEDNVFPRFEVLTKHPFYYIDARVKDSAW